MAQIIHTVEDSPAMTRDSGGRAIARDSTGRLWAVYTRRYFPFPAAWMQITVAYSDDGGLTWTEEQVTDVANTHHFFANLALDSADDVHVVYTASQRAPFPARWGVFYRKRQAGVWLAEETVALLNVANPGQDWPVIAIDSLDNAHVIWTGYGWGANPGNLNIQYRERTAAGAWLAVESITDVAFNQSQFSGLSIAIDSANNIHTSWTGLGWGGNPGTWNIRYCTKPLGGVWPASEPITDAAIWHYWPRIAIDSLDGIHVVYLAYTAMPNGDVIYANRTGPGVWPPVVIWVNDGAATTCPTIAIDTVDDIYLAWASNGHGLAPFVNNVWFTRRLTGVWQVAANLSNSVAMDNFSTSSIWANHPTIGGIKYNVMTGGIYLVWEEEDTHVLFDIAPALAPLPFTINKAYALAREEL